MRQDYRLNTFRFFNFQVFKSNYERGSVEGFLFALFAWGLIFLSVVVFGKKWLFPQPIVSDKESIDKLYTIILIITGVVLIIVKFLWGLFIWKFSAKKDSVAYFWHHSKLLEIGWTTVTAIILSILVIKGLALWGQIYSPPPKDAIQIDVFAQQFEWNIRYAGKDGKFGRVLPSKINDDEQNSIGLDDTDPASKDDIVVKNNFYLPINIPVIVRLTSRDVIHSFFLPHFRIKQDALPDMITQVWFIPKKIGTYELACAELCGLGHYRMKGTLTVVTKEEFEKWLIEKGK